MMEQKNFTVNKIPPAQRVKEIPTTVNFRENNLNVIGTHFKSLRTI